MKCDQCSKSLKGRQKRFCSNQCWSNYVADNCLTKTLSEEQEATILRMKMASVTYHAISLAVGCTADQARHVWRQHKSKGSQLYLTEKYRERRAARVALSAEIAAAKAEMGNSKPFKVGLLGEW